MITIENFETAWAQVLKAIKDLENVNLVVGDTRTARRKLHDAIEQWVVIRIRRQMAKEAEHGQKKGQ